MVMNVRRGSCRDVDGLLYLVFKFFEFKRPVIQGGRKAKPVFHKGFFPRSIAIVHPIQLGDSDMALINNHKIVFWEVVKECGWRFARGPSGKVPRIIFNTVAIAHLNHHLQVKQGALLHPLSLQKFIL